MHALPFDASEIEELVLRLNAVTAKEGMDIPDLGGNATDDAVAESLQEVDGDLSRDEITQEIETMNDEQQDALVALFWIGRGDREPAEWEETKALARQQHEGLVSLYLLGQPDAGEFLTEGLEKMLTFGVDQGQPPSGCGAPVRVGARGFGPVRRSAAAIRAHTGVGGARPP